MILKKIRVKDFRSVRDSNEFEIGNITCLVGKNESGKTALLEALYKLNPIVESEGTYNVTDDYPRSEVADYQDEIESGDISHSTVCSVVYELEDKDTVGAENDFCADVFAEKTLTLSKGYENGIEFEVSINEQAVIKALTAKSEIPIDIIGELNNCSSVEDVSTKITELRTDDNGTHLDKLQAEIKPITDIGGIHEYIYTKYIQGRIPKFLYFSDYYQMLGRVNIEALRDRNNSNKLQDSDRPLLGLIDLARLDLDSLLSPTKTQDLKNKLEGAGNRLTKTILKYWSQNKHLSIKFDVRQAKPGDPDGMTSGTNFWSEIYDSKHWATTPLGRRSRGFVWFFSFLAYFSQQKKNDTPIILILDEPGLSLHAKAQSDLLRYIEEELKDDHQVIYSTHSPFMVDPTHFDRVRIVQDIGMESDEDMPLDKDGTKVISEVLEATEDTLFPLQGALGYELHQTLFVGPNSLLVEGPSDLLYLQVMSSILERQGKTGLSNKWTITPVGGAGKIPAFVSLLGFQKRMKIATFIDIDSQNQQMIDNLIKKKLLKKKNVVTVGQLINQNAADIEDLFEKEFYIGLVNNEYDNSLSKPIDIASLNTNKPRVLKAIESYLNEQPLKNAVEFNHYRPARYFVENVGELEKSISDSTIGYFEELFKILNNIV